MIFAVTVAAVVMPPLLLVYYFYSRDVYPEPRRVVLATFVLGVLCAIPAVLIEAPAFFVTRSFSSHLGAGLTQAFLVAAIPEECLKFLVLYLYCYRHKEFDEPMDGMVYGAVASLGFATIENILYVVKGGIGVAIARGLTAVPAHAFFGAVMGYYAGQARFATAGRRALIFKSLAIPILFHGLYDFPGLTLMKAMSGDSATVTTEIVLLLVSAAVFTLGSLIFMWIWSVKLVHRLRVLQLQLQAQKMGGADGGHGESFNLLSQ